MGILLEYMSHSYPWRLEDDIKSHGTAFTDGCEQPSGY